MPGQILRYYWYCPRLQVCRTRAVDALDIGNTPRNQAGVLQRANAQRQVVALADQVHGAVAEVHLYIY